MPHGGKLAELCIEAGLASPAGASQPMPQCEVAQCESYSSSGECSCNDCSPGYRASGGSCTAVRIILTLVESEVPPPVACACVRCLCAILKCSIVCHSDVQCTVPNCQSYSTTGECVCGTCASGYQPQSGGGCAKVSKAGSQVVGGICRIPGATLPSPAVAAGGLQRTTLPVVLRWRGLLLRSLCNRLPSGWCASL